MDIDNRHFLNWIEECNTYNLEPYLRLTVDNQALGYIHRDYAQHLTEYSDLITVKGKEILFSEKINNFSNRTAAMSEISEDLYRRQLLSSWVGEQYDVSTAFDAETYFTLERAAATRFGISKYGVHINAYVLKDGKYYLWVAKRSKHKPTWPGKLDHLVAGGHSSNMSIAETMIKECGEEAGMAVELAQQAKAVGLVDYVAEINDKLSRDTLFVYDILLPESFQPKNTDGEVEEFYLWPMEKVLQRVAETRDYKTNCNLVIIDFAVRHGFITPDQPHYMAIVKGLRDNGL